MTSERKVTSLALQAPAICRDADFDRPKWVELPRTRRPRVLGRCEAVQPECILLPLARRMACEQIVLTLIALSRTDVNETIAPDLPLHVSRGRLIVEKVKSGNVTVDGAESASP